MSYLPTLSIVIPVYNEELALPHLVDKLEKFKADFSGRVEMILVNDGSSDDTAKLLDQYAKKEHVTVKHGLSNQGHQAALLEGLRLARGEMIVTMDADLQDPVESISNLVEKSREGFEIVHAQRLSRKGESFFRKVLAWAYYRIVSTLIDRRVLVDVGDFRLMTKKSLQYYLAQHSPKKFMRGEVAALPFKQTAIGYHRNPRVAGVSKFSIRKLIALACGGIFAGRARREVRAQKYNSKEKSELDFGT